MAKDPQDRFARSEEVVYRLRECREKVRPEDAAATRTKVLTPLAEAAEARPTSAASTATWGPQDIQRQQDLPNGRKKFLGLF